MGNHLAWLVLATLGLAGCVSAPEPESAPEPPADPEDGDPPQIDPDACVVPNTAKHCGACGYACNPGMACVSGACERAVFATSEVFDGNLGGLDGAHAKCQRLAEAAGLAHEFKAWLSDHDTGPLDTFTRSSAPYRLVGEGAPKIAESFEELVTTRIGERFAGIEQAIDRDETGDPITTFRHAWTGTISSGMPTEMWWGELPVGIETCTEWTTAADVTSTADPCWSNGTCIYGTAGYMDLVRDTGEVVPQAWTWGAGWQCSATWRLYCFEQQ